MRRVCGPSLIGPRKGEMQTQKLLALEAGRSAQNFCSSNVGFSCSRGRRGPCASKARDGRGCPL